MDVEEYLRPFGQVAADILWKAYEKAVLYGQGTYSSKRMRTKYYSFGVLSRNLHSKNTTNLTKIVQILTKIVQILTKIVAKSTKIVAKSTKSSQNRRNRRKNRIFQRRN